MFLPKILLFLLFTITGILPQDTPDKIVTLKVIPKQKTLRAGTVVDIELTLDIKKGWHINANKPLDANLIPTNVTVTENSAFKVIGIDFPQPFITMLAFSENELALYEDEAVIKLQIKIDEKFKGKKLVLKGKVQYQPCNDQTCLFPFSKEFNIDLKVSKK